jgi:hypothetical protein
MDEITLRIISELNNALAPVHSHNTLNNLMSICPRSDNANNDVRATGRHVNRRGGGRPADGSICSGRLRFRHI